MEVKETNHNTSILNPKTTPKYFPCYKHDVAYSDSHNNSANKSHIRAWYKKNQFILRFIKAYKNIPWFYEAAFPVENCGQ